MAKLAIIVRYCDVIPESMGSQVLPHSEIEGMDDTAAHGDNAAVRVGCKVPGVQRSVEVRKASVRSLTQLPWLAGGERELVTCLRHHQQSGWWADCTIRIADDNHVLARCQKLVL